MRSKLPHLLLPLLAAPLAAAPESHPCQNGLVRSLVAREPMFRNPVAVAVDVDGTIYVTETTRRKQADLDIARRHMAIRARRAAMQQERG